MVKLVVKIVFLRLLLHGRSAIWVIRNPLWDEKFNFDIVANGCGVEVVGGVEEEGGLGGIGACVQL